MLELVKGTPINCLVGESRPPIPLDGLEFIALKAGAPPPGVALREGIWPGVKGAQRGGDSADAGPTGGPWVDSNAGVIRLARAQAPEAEVWLTYPAPAASEVVPMEFFPLPVIEAECYGAHWVISLHPSLAEGLRQRSDAALAAWKRMMAALKLAASHPEWRRWEPVAALAVVSDFEGENEFLGGEFLNLAPRRHLAYRIVREEEVQETSFAGQQAILYINAAPPADAIREKLLAFASDGGLLITPAGLMNGEPAATKQGFNLYNWGKGKVASPQEEWYDPYILVADVHMLISHRLDVVRLWNASVMNSHYTAAPDGKRAVVQLLSYGGSRRNEELVSLRVAAAHGKARMFTLDGPAEVELVRHAGGTEARLPPFRTYAAVEFEA